MVLDGVISTKMVVRINPRARNRVRARVRVVNTKKVTVHSV